MQTLLDEGIKKLKEEQEHHCKTHFFGKLTKPTSTTVNDSEGNEYVVVEGGRDYQILPGRKNI